MILLKEEYVTTTFHFAMRTKLSSTLVSCIVSCCRQELVGELTEEGIIQASVEVRMAAELSENITGFVRAVH